VTGQTPKDVPRDAEDVDAVETGEQAPTETTETKAAKTGTRPAAKRRRRVRVIEVLDDDDDLDADLEEVLEALDEQDTKDEDEDEKPEKPAKPKEPKARPRREPVSLDKADEPTFLGMRRIPAVVVIVLLGVLSTVAVWQWRTAAGLSSEKSDREAVAAVARAYGDVAMNYNAANYQSQMRKAQALMGGDLLESFTTNTLPNMGMTSKTVQVFVGTVDEPFASATISVDVSLRTAQGTSSARNTLLRLNLAKTDGRWKITEQFTSGRDDQAPGQQGALPTTAPSATPTGSPSASPTRD
jgi:hypothetical protein